MILIISGEEDISTNHVIDWLRSYQFPYVRISEKDPLKVISLNPNVPEKMRFSIRGKEYQLNNFTSIWYRRSWLVMEPVKVEGIDGDALDTAITRQLNHEREILLEYVLKVFKKNSLNTQLDNSLNKLSVLESCKRWDIRVPETLVTTDKNELLRFKDKCRNIITKNFSPGVFVITDKGMLSSITLEVSEAMIDSLDEVFSPMLFQEMIPKSFEIRTFYLDGKFFSSAIFSQNDELTKVDFRNYNQSKPNRTPPYKLPKSMERKLKNLMEEYGLNSGSIDLLVDRKGDFVFLEVNPIGQFYQVSHPCNYHLENEIAKHLMKSYGNYVYSQ